MAIKEQDKVFYEETENGDKVINLPVTRANNVEGLGRSANTAYVVGDVVYVDNNKKVALKCITGGTTSNAELDISTNNIGDTVTDGSVVWQVCNRTSDVTSVNGKTGDVVVDLPVGHMYWSVEPNVPAGRLPASGAVYNRPLYSSLYAWAEANDLVISESEWQAIASANGGNCAYYSSGDGSTTFRVPKLPNTIVTDASDGEVPVYGNGISIGLTDGKHKGTMILSTNYGFSESGQYGKPVGTDDSGSPFDAGITLGITTDSTKSGIVAKPSATKITGQWLIVAFGVAHNIGEADVANVMQAVEQVQTGLGQVDGIVDYIVESYRNGTEWYEVYKSGKVRQGGFCALASGDTTRNITLLKTYKTTNYSVTLGVFEPEHNGGMRQAYVEKQTTTKLTLLTGYTSGNASVGCYWQAEGQGA